MRAQIEVLDHLGTKHGRDIGSRGHATTGSDFFRDTAAAHNVAALENERSQSAARKVRSGSKAVVAGADNDGIVRFTQVRAQELADLGSL
jgi:hypothetical protein